MMRITKSYRDRKECRCCGLNIEVPSRGVATLQVATLCIVARNSSRSIQKRATIRITKNTGHSVSQQLNKNAVKGARDFLSALRPQPTRQTSSSRVNPEASRPRSFTSTSQYATHAFSRATYMFQRSINMVTTYSLLQHRSESPARLCSNSTGLANAASTDGSEICLKCNRRERKKKQEERKTNDAYREILLNRAAKQIRMPQSIAQPFFSDNERRYQQVTRFSLFI